MYTLARLVPRNFSTVTPCDQRRVRRPSLSVCTSRYLSRKLEPIHQPPRWAISSCIVLPVQFCFKLMDSCLLPLCACLSSLEPPIQFVYFVRDVFDFGQSLQKFTKSTRIDRLRRRGWSRSATTPTMGCAIVCWGLLKLFQFTGILLRWKVLTGISWSLKVPSSLCEASNSGLCRSRSETCAVEDG